MRGKAETVAERLPASAVRVALPVITRYAFLKTFKTKEAVVCVVGGPV